METEVPEGWIDFEGKQPIGVAILIYRAEMFKHAIQGIQEQKKTARQQADDARKALSKTIRETEKFHKLQKNKGFFSLPEEYRIGTLYKPEEILGFRQIKPDPKLKSDDAKEPPYKKYRELTDKIKTPSSTVKFCSAKRQIEYATDRIHRLTGSTTKTFEKSMEIFCSGMGELYRERGVSPNYRLIADIANHFGLSKRHQTYDSIAKRFDRSRD